jgi:hypothetical protein
MPSIKTSLLFLALAVPWQSGLLAQEVPVLDSADPLRSFGATAEYLSADGGRWKAANPDYNPSAPRGPSHFGLWFDWHPNLQLLELRIVTHVGDSARVSSRGHWVWHPGGESLRYVMSSPGGRYTEGDTTFESPHTFTTVATLYRSGDPPSQHRDENVLVSPGLHRNLSFQKAADGTWTNQGTYEWHRVRSPQ